MHGARAQSASPCGQTPGAGFRPLRAVKEVRGHAAHGHGRAEDVVSEPDHGHGRAEDVASEPDLTFAQQTTSSHIGNHAA